MSRPLVTLFAALTLAHGSASATEGPGKPAATVLTPAPTSATTIETLPASSPQHILREDFGLPVDLQVKQPAEAAGSTAATLSGWWLGGIPFMRPRNVLVFEEFSPDGTASIIVAAKATSTRPARWARITAGIGPDGTVTSRVSDTSSVTLRLAKGKLQGQITSANGSSDIEFERASPQ